MVITCGEFPAELPYFLEALKLEFPGHTRNPRVRSRNISLSANYLAAYIASFAPPNTLTATGTSVQRDLQDTVSYIANELLENAVKFNYDPESALSLQVGIAEEGLACFVLVNTVNIAQIDALRARFDALLSADPLELYLEHIEAGAAAGETSASGLGLLTMLNDYGARLAWRIEAPSEARAATLTTLVQLVR